MDYLRPVEFGLFVTPAAAALDNCFALARIADGKVELLGVQDTRTNRPSSTRSR